MNTSITSSITDGQKKQYTRLVEDATKHAVGLALGKIEADQDGWQRVLGHGDELREALAELVVAKTRELSLKCGGFEPTTSQKRAREIMGKNFFGVEEAQKHFGVNPTPEQLAIFAEIPFSEAVLEESKNTHILVAVFPLSILKIRNQIASKLFYNQSWYNNEPFVKDRITPSWQLVRKTEVANSTSKNWQEQQTLIGKDDEVPTAQVMVYTIIGHYLATGERLFEHIYVRTSSVASDGFRVVVGYFASVGLRVRHYWDVRRRGGLGVSSARKF